MSKLIPKRKEFIKHAVFQTSFHGETWYKCPHCGRNFEFYDAFFEHYGIKKSYIEKVYVCSCGELFSVG